MDYAAHRCVATAATAVGVHCDSVYTWLHTLLTLGVTGLRSAPKAGRRPKLSSDQKARLRELLVAGPEAAGYAAGGWHSPLVAALIEREAWALVIRRRALCPIISMRRTASSG